jgi:hypothetical protein
MGVRVNEREGSVLQLQQDARQFGKELPEPLKSRAEWLHEACLRVLDWNMEHRNG